MVKRLQEVYTEHIGNGVNPDIMMKQNEIEIITDETSGMVTLNAVVDGLHQSFEGQNTKKFIVNCNVIDEYTQQPQIIKTQQQVDMSLLASSFGITPDKIKAGETILGITGTYTGETTE